MANRRMFSNDVVGTDSFIDMPLSAQALYFQLGMQTDDDGFVSCPRKVQRMLGASDDDLKLLIAKGFLLSLGNGVIVIAHFRQHNQLRPDRYKPSLYSEERSRLFVCANKAYTLDGSIDGAIPLIAYNCNTLIDSELTGNQLATNGNRNIVKSNSGQIRQGETRIGQSNATSIVDLLQPSELATLRYKVSDYEEFVDEINERLDYDFSQIDRPLAYIQVTINDIREDRQISDCVNEEDDYEEN